jgi:lipopolysaccharide transport system ATP-binding protein
VSEIEPIINASELHKEYVLQVQRASLKAMVLSGGRRSKEVVHALRGINLSVAPGEAVALVGRNGSGKSTFLGLIAKIYLPSSGTLQVRGKVAPLLELGAGFHHELTGWENIELNGVILGLTRKQVRERAGSIVEFAELERFIHAALRTYSSGMMMRLAFSVAVHTDSEILVVDEALAVGDEEFQEKCFHRIDRLKQEGRTILFVSHEMTDVTRVATRAVWFDSGLIRMDADPQTVVEQYLAESHQHSEAEALRDA